MRFSLIHPSRSRPEKSIRTMMDWIAKSAFRNLDIIVSLDCDDDTLSEYYSHYEKLNFPFSWLDEVNVSSVDAINKAAKEATGDILIVVSDDTTCPINWDKILIEAIGNRKDFLLKVNHGLANSVVTMPVMDRAFYNRTGYIYYPEYKHLYCDTDLTERAKRLGRLIVRNDILFEHLHPEKTGEPKDALYLRNDATYHQGKELFQQRQKINFGL